MSNLKQVREKAGISQNQLAQLAGINRQSVHLYEKGEALPRVDSAVALAVVLNTTVEALWPIEYEEETITIRRLKR